MLIHYFTGEKEDNEFLCNIFFSLWFASLPICLLACIGVITIGYVFPIIYVLSWLFMFFSFVMGICVCFYNFIFAYQMDAWDIARSILNEIE